MKVLTAYETTQKLAEAIGETRQNVDQLSRKGMVVAFKHQDPNLKYYRMVKGVLKPVRNGNQRFYIYSKDVIEAAGKRVVDLRSYNNGRPLKVTEVSGNTVTHIQVSQA